MEKTPIRLTVNGEPLGLEAGDAPPTLSELIAQFGLEGERVAVERNSAVVPREHHGREALAESDVVEVVSFVGGGDPAFEDAPLTAMRLACEGGRQSFLAGRMPKGKPSPSSPSSPTRGVMPARQGGAA